MKSLKLFTVLSGVIAVGGVSALTVLTTSCGGDKVKDFGTWDMNGQMPETWPVNIADAIVGYEIVIVVVYPWNDYNAEGAMMYMDGIEAQAGASDYDFPYMYTNPGASDFNFYSGQPDTYNLKVLANHLPMSGNMTYLGKLTAIITHVN